MPHKAPPRPRQGPTAKTLLHLPAVWARLSKGTPDALTSLCSVDSLAYMLRRQRWMDLIVTFGAHAEAARLLHPRDERRERP